MFKLALTVGTVEEIGLTYDKNKRLLAGKYISSRTEILQR